MRETALRGVVDFGSGVAHASSINESCSALSDLVLLGKRCYGALGGDHDT